MDITICKYKRLLLNCMPFSKPDCNNRKIDGGLYMPNYYIYPIFTIIVAAAALLIIPKEQYKYYLLNGFLFGGFGQILIASLLTALNLIQYKNMGPFNILGDNFGHILHLPHRLRIITAPC